MNRPAWTQSLVAALLVAVLVPALSACGRAAEKDAADASTPATATGSAPKQAAKPAGPKPGVIPTNTLVPQIKPESLQPPSYAGYERLPSFTYHHVDPKLKNDIAITPATFEAQLKVLKDGGYHTITARQLADYHSKGTPLPDKPVMITFDDGWKNQYEYAAPLLKKYGFVATYFINPQPIGRGSAYMTKDMLVQLTKDGNDIEPHTWTHKQLTRTRKDDQLEFQRAHRQADDAREHVDRAGCRQEAGGAVLPVRLLRHRGHQQGKGRGLQGGVHHRGGRRRRPSVGRDDHEAVHHRAGRLA